MVGEWKRGVVNGNGKVIEKDGDIYEGVWSNGKISEGTYTQKDGSKYTGSF